MVALVYVVYAVYDCTTVVDDLAAQGVEILDSETAEVLRKFDQLINERLPEYERISIFELDRKMTDLGIQIPEIKDFNLFQVLFNENEHLKY